MNNHFDEVMITLNYFFLQPVYDCGCVEAYFWIAIFHLALSCIFANRKINFHLPISFNEEMQ